MCGLVSIHVSGTSIDAHAASVEAMLATIAHRGPDGSGRRQVTGQMVQAHVRLAIIDPEHGQQPMVSEDGRYSIVFNGEIYNHVELRSELVRRGVSLRTGSDTEVLLALLVADGTRAIPRLNGMFAFVLHDRQTNQWIAARDPFGIKPLYVVRLSDAVLFASETKALLVHPGVTARLDLHSLAQYVVFQYTIGDRTMFEGIEKVPAATFVEGCGATVTNQRRYWTPNTTVTIGDERIAATQIRAALDNSVRLQLRSDVPIGGYLSGGMDSSAICSLATHLSGRPLAAFHGRFADVDGYDESTYARALATSIGADLHVVTPTSADFVEHLPRIVHLLDEPVAGPGAFAQYMVSRLAADEVKVVLGGQGGDEIFGGYARYLVAYLEQAIKGAITDTQEEGQHVVTLDNVTSQLRVLRSYFPLIRQFWSRGVFESMDRRYFVLVDRSDGVYDMLHPDLRAELDLGAVHDEYLELFNQPDTPSYINKMLAFDMATLLPALLQVEDRMSMGASVESRVPLLDTRIVDLLGSVAPSIKFGAGVGKHALRLALGDLVPPAVLDRSDKMGFPVPLVEWMQHAHMSAFVHDSVLGTSSTSSLIDRGAAQRLLADGRYTNRQLWGLLSLQMWHGAFLDG